MTDITITRWKRYGKDHGYAALADGTKLGWIDLKTGAVTIERGADAVVVADALRTWMTAIELPQVGGLVSPEPRFAELPPSPAVAVADGLEGGADQLPAIAAPVIAQSVGADPRSADEAYATLPDLDVTAQATTQPALGTQSGSPLPPSWTDLALHRPGELVRAEAAAKWEANKAESKLFAYGARLFDVKTDERAWRVGAKGEEIVGNRLEELVGRGWCILHSIPVGKNDSDIDHVAIGPGGVFTFNTKRHPNAKAWVGQHQIRVNGAPVDYLRNSRFEASRASKLLTARAGFRIEAVPCIVISGAESVTIKQQPDDVIVLTARDIPGWFKKRPAVLTREKVEAIYAVARRSDTWV